MERDRKLNAEELPIEQQNLIIEMNSQGMPLIKIRDKLKEDYGTEISDKSLQRFTLKYIEPKLPKEFRDSLEKSFDRASKNVEELHQLNIIALKKLIIDNEMESKEWYGAVRTVGINILDTFRVLSILQGQRIATEREPDTEEEIDRTIELIRIATEKAKERGILDSSTDAFEESR